MTLSQRCASRVGLFLFPVDRTTGQDSEQTIEHQRTRAEKTGLRLDEVIWDDGVSGVSTKLRERPQGRRLFDLLRSGDTLVPPCRFVEPSSGTKPL